MDGEEQRTLWDLKYRQGLPSLTRPDPFFVSAYERFVEPSFPNAGLALDLAGGLGRHALWLATRKWRVSVVDISEVAIGKLRQAADQLNVDTCLFAQDVAEFNFEAARFDLIILFYHLDRSLFPKIVAALSPGGLFVCKMAVRWSTEIGLATAADNPLARTNSCHLFQIWM
jgi:SAM-dependent methyltransferase